MLKGKPNSVIHAKPMLSIEEQVAHLEERGVSFKACSKEEAATYLALKNNYYKVVSYRKLFPIRRGGPHDGEYANLDFAYLKDLSAIDQALRYALLPMTLDIEHFAKVKLLALVAGKESEDGYSIVADYLASLTDSRRRRIDGELEVMAKDPYCGDMVAKYRDDVPIWVFAESVSFGTFIGFYRYCAERWGDKELKNEHYLLRQTKSVRNAAAHSSNIVNGFGGQSSQVGNYKLVSEALAAIGVSKGFAGARCETSPFSRLQPRCTLTNGLSAGNRRSKEPQNNSRRSRGAWKSTRRITR